jgi:hypothetical protein
MATTAGVQPAAMVALTPVVPTQTMALWHTLQHQINAQNVVVVIDGPVFDGLNITSLAYLQQEYR